MNQRHQVASVLLVLACWGCSASGSVELPDVAVDGPGSTDTLPDSLFETDSQGGEDLSPADVVADHTPPQILDLKLQKNSQCVLSALISFRTNEPATWTLEVTDEQTGTAWAVKPILGVNLTHQVPVLGLRPMNHYSFTLKVADSSGNSTTSKPLAMETPPLPEGFPPLRFLGSEPNKMAPGYTLFNVLKWSDIQGSGLLAAVDSAGMVVWYFQAAQPLVEAQMTAQGTLLAVIGEYHGIIEIDMLGNLLHHWKPEQLGLDSLHHALGLTPEGNLLGLATELRVIDGYPTQSGGTRSYSVVGELAVEFTRSGQLLHAHSMLDVLDPYHYSLGFFVPFWLPLYPNADGGPKDWGHGNGIQWVVHGQSYLVTLANQEMVLNVDRATGKPLWKAGESGDVVLKGLGEPGGATWFSNPHGVELSDDGRLLVYDDGTYKGAAVPRSRVVQYQMTPPELVGDPWKAKQIWSWDGQDSAFYSMSPADVDYLPGGNLLVVHGSLVQKPELSPYSLENSLSARIQELALVPEVVPVFGLEIGGPWDSTHQRLSSFAAIRVSTLYSKDWGVENVELDCDIICGDTKCGTKGGCTCGLCSLGQACQNGECLSCEEACTGRTCGPVELVCDCGSCQQGKMCDAQGSCQDAAEFCQPYCEGKECGVVGAFYLGQTCDCGLCPDTSYCDYQTFVCLPN